MEGHGHGRTVLSRALGPHPDIATQEPHQPFTHQNRSFLCHGCGQFGVNPLLTPLAISSVLISASSFFGQQELCQKPWGKPGWGTDTAKKG